MVDQIWVRTLSKNHFLYEAEVHNKGFVLKWLTEEKHKWIEAGTGLDLN